MSRAVETAPPPDAETLLPGAHFADAFQIHVAGRLTAREAASIGMARTPGWARALIKLRNLLVRPFGLKRPPSNDPSQEEGGPLWIPMVSESAERVVLGFDDLHLDFRVLVDAAAEGDRTRMTVTTLVRTHGWGGRAYLRAIEPFHRLIVKRMLERAAR